MNENTSSDKVDQQEAISGQNKATDREEQSYDSGQSSNGAGQRDEVTESNCRFTPGEPLRFARVRFPGHARSYPFLVGKRKLMYGQKVMAMSDRGMAVGYVNSFVYELPFDKSMLPLRSINKIATEEDIVREQDTYQKQKSTETLCQRLIDKHNLDMNLTHVEFTQFGKKVVFYFVAPARVDFRNLVKDLVAELKLRIELRQISVRDRAASMGALGPCGRELCCSSFLSRYGNVSIKMAKNQNLTLNYSKLNGVCGQLKCCLQYEDEVYHQKRKRLPKEGSFIETLNGEKGKIFRLHILSEQFDLLTEKGKIKRFTQDYFKRKLKPQEVNMPDRFENISDETSIVIGLSETEGKKTAVFEKEMVKLKLRAGKYASEIFEDLTGVPVTDQQETPQQKEALSQKDQLNQKKSESSYSQARGFDSEEEHEHAVEETAYDDPSSVNEGEESPEGVEATHEASESRDGQQGPRRPRNRRGGSGQRRGNKRRGPRGGGAGSGNKNKPTT